MRPVTDSQPVVGWLPVVRRFRLRGLQKVNGEALLIAAGQNLKRLLSRWGWGRRPFPNGSLGVVLPPLSANLP